MDTFIQAYGELGVLGCCVAMFMFLVYSLNQRGKDQADSLENLKIENSGQSKVLTEILKESEEQKSIIIKLIDRFNVSDSTAVMGREKVIDEISDLTEKVAEIRGSISRMNGHG